MKQRMPSRADPAVEKTIQWPLSLAPSPALASGSLLLWKPPTPPCELLTPVGELLHRQLPGLLSSLFHSSTFNGFLKPPEDVSSSSLASPNGPPTHASTEKTSKPEVNGAWVIIRSFKLLRQSFGPRSQVLFEVNTAEAYAGLKRVKISNPPSIISPGTSQAQSIEALR